MDNRSDIWRGVDEIKARFIDLSDKVWGMPEVCYTEARSAAEHLVELRHQGFRITENLAGGYVGNGMKEVAGFLMIIVVLMIRPFGLFGERDIERV